MSSSYYFWNKSFDDDIAAQEEQRRVEEEGLRIAEQERRKYEEAGMMTPFVVSETKINTNNPYDQQLLLGDQAQTNPFSSDNSVQGPISIPPPVSLGGNSLAIPVTTDPTVIGAIDPKTGLPYRQDPSPVPIKPGDFNPNEGSLGPNNPTVYAGGDSGLFGSGIDIGIPGLVSIGGLMGAGGGLLGLGGAMGGGGGGGGGSAPVDTTAGMTTIPVFGLPSGNQPSASLPPANTPLTNSGGSDNGAYGPGINETPPDTVTLPPIVPIQNNPPPPPDSSPPVTLPPVPIPNNTPTPAITPPQEIDPNTPITLPINPFNTVQGPGAVNPGETPSNPITLPPITQPPVTPPPVITVPNPPAPNPPSTSTPSTPMATPLDRNYYTEGNQTSQDFSQLGPNIYNNYANYSRLYGNADLSNYGAVLPGVGGYNSQLTGYANQQTAESNTALRTGNVNDASALGGQALATLRQLNPNLYTALTQAQGASGTAGQPSDIQTMLEKQAREGLALGTQLDPQDIRAAQQSAREAWSARGLVNSPGAIGEEVLNRYNLGQQRLQQRQGLAQQVDATGFNQRQQGYGNVLQNAQLQSQNAFNPFQTITSANTQNQGTNQNLFGQAAGFSSGSFGNQNVNSLVNPFNPYAQDVYGSNFNAANARYISAGNNAAAIQGAHDATNGQLVNSFLGYLGTLCWVAREVYTEDNPRWKIFRSWMLNRAPEGFRKLYLRYGEEFAEFIKDKPELKFAIREWMDARVTEYVNGEPTPSLAFNLELMEAA